MARQTRAERQARREARERSGAAERPRDGRPAMRPAVQPVTSQPGRQVPGSGQRRSWRVPASAGWAPVLQRLA